MKIKAQTAMVMNLDKCLSCHTCTIPCKNAWTTRPGTDYIWFNNVETKPGIGYPREWENQEKYRGGWKLSGGKPKLRMGGRLGRFMTIFANSDMPTIQDYYEPWNYNYKYLTDAPAGARQPAVGPRSSITGELMKVSWGPNWEDDLAGANVTGLYDVNFRGMEAKAWLQYKTVFMFQLPRICEHCLHPACVASCPSGALYKRDEDGIVLVDQTRCRSWRMCESACPYKKVYLNWKTHRSEKCIFCYPRIEAGKPTLCAQTCPGRIRYVGVMLYDADRVKEAAGNPDEAGLYESQLGVFMDPHDQAVADQALRDGVPWQFIEAARKSPIYKLACEWKLALPLHPEFRTLPMVWYIPPLSPMINAGAADPESLDNMRIPVKYLANLLAAGDERPVRRALNSLLAMRALIRSQRLAQNRSNDQTGDKPNGQDDFAANNWPVPGAEADEEALKAAELAGLNSSDALAMYRLLALARLEERFVIPSTQLERADDADAMKGEAGFPECVS